MSARDDHPFGKTGALDHYAMCDEIDRLRAWKESASEVLARWDAVWETAGRPGPLGYSKAACVQDLIAALRAQVERDRPVIAAAREATRYWGVYAATGYSSDTPSNRARTRLLDAVAALDSEVQP